jgi:predicted AAA+ superfamily ATPase
MNKNKIVDFIYEWHSEILATGGIHRDYEDRLLELIGSKPIKIVTGFRRSGKSFLIRRLIKRLNCDLNNVLYINLEDIRLAQVTSGEDLYDLYQVFLTTIAKTGPKLLVFDEIQNARNWDKFIRTIYEKDSDIEIIIIGSNSELLSSELGTNLAGRFIEFVIQGFSFKEFLTFKNIMIESEQSFHTQRIQIERLFNEYMTFGGLPEVFDINNDDAKFSYLQGVISKVILSDVIERFKVRNVIAIERMLQYIFANTGEIISFAKIKNYLKGLGIDLDIDTVVTYVDFLTKTFAINDVQKFDWKTNKVFSTSKKYYAIDLGFVSLFRDLSNNFSKKLENIVYLKLKRDKCSQKIFYGRNDKKQEIDLITRDRKNKFIRYQVTRDLHENNYKREINPFLDSDNYLKTSEAILLSLDLDSDDLREGELLIKQKNIIKCLLDLS